MARYLTDGEKREALDWLRSRIEVGNPDGSGGKGYIDLNLVPHLAEINALKGVCTLQSCAGHRAPAADGIGDNVLPGNLWLRFSEDVHARFMSRVDVLLALSCVRSVSVLLHKADDLDGVREIVSVDFKGDECGEFDYSISQLKQFLTWMSESATRLAA